MESRAQEVMTRCDVERAGPRVTLDAEGDPSPEWLTRRQPRGIFEKISVTTGVLDR